MADVKYTNLDRLNGLYDQYGRRKIATAVDNWNKNPYFMLGNMIGQAIFEPYFEKKRAKTEQEARDSFKKYYGLDKNGGSAGSTVNEAVKEAGNTAMATKNAKWDDYAKALETYRSANGLGADANGVYGVPQTPQQANKSTDVPTVGQAWQNMVNGSGYNPGNTTLYTNGVRNMNNVIGADANGVYGVQSATPGVIIDTSRGIYPQATSSAPSVANFPQKPANGPAPYTDDQLRQIAAQNFTPDELSRMTTEAERARMNALMNPAPVVAQAVAPSGGGGLLTPVANRGYIPEEEAAALDRKTMFVPEEEAALAEAYRVANNFSRAAATPAGAADFNSRFITPGHNKDLEWHPFAYQPSVDDEIARENTRKWWEENMK
jgi:hypothetical protein